MFFISGDDLLNVNNYLFTAPEDYNATTTLLTFQQHNQTLCVAIPIVNDDTPERVEAFTVILSSDNLELPVRLDNGISEATVTIMDDDGR